MTNTLSNTANPLSRISIGTLEDLGYTVDYTQAEPFDSSSLDPSCRCDQSRRSLHGTAAAATKEEPRSLQETEADAQTREQAIAYGREFLQSRVMGNVGGRHAAKNQMIIANSLSVFYQREDGSIADELVTL